MKVLQKTVISLIILVSGFTLTADTDEEKNKTDIIPLIAYDYLSLDKQSVHSPGGGIILKNEETMFVNIYQFHKFNHNFQTKSPDKYHTIDSLFDMKKNNHQYLALFKSESDKPIFGGLHTYQTAAAYGYQFFQVESFSFIFGGGFAIGDFGIERDNGKAWPIIPVPLIRIKAVNNYFDFSLDFITGPNINLVIAPESQIRLSGDFRIDRFRDSRDLIFDCALHYRFFPKNHEYGDIAGVSAGIKNDELNFDISENKDSVGVQYYATYGKLDLSLIQITGGYAFKGIERHKEEEPIEIGSGFYISFQALYQF